uniref:Uncharacterized protein n=1 Tax=Arundo donax TaxID=35708 RepID=A0A0A9CKZ5_ARUDO
MDETEPLHWKGCYNRKLHIKDLK